MAARIIRQPADDEAVRVAVHEWVELLGEGRYSDALAFLYQGDINPFFDQPERPAGFWTEELLRDTIARGGLEPGPADASAERRVAPDMTGPVTVSWVDTATGDTLGLDPAVYAGLVHATLPLADSPATLTARLLLRRAGPHLALELYDVQPPV